MTPSFMPESKLRNMHAHLLQNALHSILKWGHGWQMLFNLNKCKVLHVGRNNPNVQYVMDGIPLENVTEEKRSKNYSY